MSNATKAATPEDFTRWLQYHLDECAKETEVAIAAHQNETASKGAFGAGHYGVKRFEIAENGFKRGIDLALAQCRRGERITKIDHSTLRRKVEDQLIAFRDTIKSMALPTRGLHEGVRTIIQDRLPNLDTI